MNTLGSQPAWISKPEFWSKTTRRSCCDSELASPRWEPQAIAISGVTDAYQPIERRLQLTRRCLEVLVEFRNPVVIITKNELVTRDIDLLERAGGVSMAFWFSFP